MRIIGRTAKVNFPEFGVFGKTAKVDTGARNSSLHVENMREEQRDGKIHLVFNPISDKNAEVATTDFKLTRVKSSFGEIEERYKINIRVERRRLSLETPFTLTNRGSQRNAVLLGRKYLKDGNFIIDLTWRAKNN